MSEKNNLDIHLVECEKRFQEVVVKMDRLESRMDVIEDILIDIKQSLRIAYGRSQELHS
jgi:hypothetical protein